MASRHAPQSTRLEKVARLALETAEKSFPAHYHRFAPKVFRLPQLVACLVLKVYLKQDYRGIEEILRVSPPLVKALGLKKVPDHTTLLRAAQAATTPRLSAMLEAALKSAGITQSQAALDATGFEVGNASAYFQTRRGATRRQWVKLSMVVLLPSLMVAHATAGWGPSNDKTAFRNTVLPATKRVELTDLFADKGYDAEWVHRWCRGRRGIRSWIPPVVHRKDGTVGGHWRQQMADRLSPEYGSRWGIETVNSVIKRRWGGGTTAKTRWGQRREALLKSVVYSIDK